jgi:hypothetical protein
LHPITNAEHRVAGFMSRKFEGNETHIQGQLSAQND